MAMVGLFALMLLSGLSSSAVPPCQVLHKVIEFEVKKMPDGKLRARSAELLQVASKCNESEGTFLGSQPCVQETALFAPWERRRAVSVARPFCSGCPLGGLLFSGQV